MKTFEERYTAWIDGKLEGPALTSFELELSRRASAGEARADKADAARLHLLLMNNLKAPTMTNAEFFSHQLRERIEAERRISGRRREEARQGRTAIFSWPFARLAGLGAAGLFVATALYYGMMPPRNTTVSTPVVATTSSSTQPGAPVAASVQAADPAVTQRPTLNAGPSQLAQASPMPTPVDLNGDIQVINVPATSTNTSATPLHLKDPNVNVLWINGLDYMSTVPEASPAAGAAPAGSAAP